MQSDPAQRYATCAIVANGGIMLNAMEGAEIDAHDAVLRINYAPVTVRPTPNALTLSARSLRTDISPQRKEARDHCLTL